MVPLIVRVLAFPEEQRTYEFCPMDELRLTLYADRIKLDQVPNDVLYEILSHLDMVSVKNCALTFNRKLFFGNGLDGLKTLTYLSSNCEVKQK